MNIRKNIDYSEMYAALDTVMADRMPQMELYCAIGKAVCRRAEKGAAVAASEYLCKKYPDVHGLSPRSLRRMRDFYRTYENEPQLMAQAMEIGWIQNVVIMEANLTMELRKWYIQAVKQFGWSKAELTARIAENAHEFIVLAIAEEMCYSEEQEEVPLPVTDTKAVRANKIRHLIARIRCRWRIHQGGWRRWPTTLWLISMGKRNAFVRCYNICTSLRRLIQLEGPRIQFIAELGEYWQASENPPVTHFYQYRPWMRYAG